jgi:hypothetical protein
MTTAETKLPRALASLVADARLAGVEVVIGGSGMYAATFTTRTRAGRVRRRLAIVDGRAFDLTVAPSIARAMNYREARSVLGIPVIRVDDRVKRGAP